tara:strand:+ start:89 stop:295 length:207 start_codon:yes stop_codon:yes gene_type:complete
MLIKVFFDRENRNESLELEEGSRINNILEKFSINPVTVIVAKNGEVVTKDEKLENNDDVKILSVLSGG